MKFVIFPTYANNPPRCLQSYLDDKPFPYNRIGDIVEFLENSSIKLNHKNAENKIRRSERFWDESQHVYITSYIIADRGILKCVYVCEIDMTYQLDRRPSTTGWYEVLIPKNKYLIKPAEDIPVLIDAGYKFDFGL